MKKVVCLCSALIAFCIPVYAGPGAAVNLLSIIEKEEMPQAGLNQFLYDFKEGASPKIYMVTDGYDGTNIWLKIDGTLVNLKLDASKSEKPISYTVEKEGDHFRRAFSSADTTAMLDYLITNVGQADDCTVTTYTVTLNLKKWKRSQSIELLNKWGC